MKIKILNQFFIKRCWIIALIITLIPVLCLQSLYAIFTPDHIDYIIESLLGIYGITVLTLQQKSNSK